MEASEDYMCQLADELALRILWYLDGKEILQVAQTCRRWRQLAEDEGLWQGKCKARGIEEPLCITRRKAKASRSGPWKSSYIRQLSGDTNWRRGKFNRITLRLTSENCRLYWMAFNGKELVGTSHREIIKIWSAVTGECLRTLVGHTNSITEIQMRDHIIVSGCEDGTVNVWNAESGESLHTLCGHIDYVHHVHLHKQRAATCSLDCTIRVWDIETGRCLHVLSGHEAAVTWVWYNGHRLMSKDFSNVVKIWEPETETCLLSVCLHSGAFTTPQFDGKHIVSLLFEDRMIGVWDGETLQRTHTITGDKSYTPVMTLQNSILGVATTGRTAEIWNVATGQRVNLLTHPDGFDLRQQSLVLRGDFLIGRTDTGRVSLWDWRTGTFLRNLFVPNTGESLDRHLLVSNTKLMCVVADTWQGIFRYPTKAVVLDFDVKDWARRKICSVF
ncbi:F-box/WD repeat-containing protein 7-like [Xenopus laevis]|uniref:F-box/WD repeat-containing protein 7-like n=2 Tax=Xenopus laevis TaxID=8355 RepID=A0A1L8GIA9_XENLA|nr:F-box/WD repeat-containing protein 7-like [Xenopus laevis]OCT83559.1 hypothetical protein XELAEV_18021701mg [Xenopus laevis]